jgi:uncharacterized protein YecE (DUF72 family)
MAELFFGTSGWSYKEWVGPFYIDEKRMFSYYSRFFTTVEINSTFYRYPSRSTIYGLNRVSPRGFVFSAKLPKLITHKKKLDPEENIKNDLMRFLELLEPLSATGKLGCILVQLPPKFTFDRDFEKLTRFLEMIPDHYEFAVEFRDPSWLRDETWKILRSHNVAYCVVDEPAVPPEVQVTASFAYFRWHGRSRRPWYNYRYSEEELKGWAPRVEETSRKVEKVYGYFNNHFHGYAVENCIEFMQMMKIARPEHERIKRRIIDYNLFGKVERAEAGAGTRTAAEKEVWRLLLKLTDLGRIRRGRRIGDGDLRILESSSETVRAEVKDYTVEIQIKKKTLRHDCDDWLKGMNQGRLCKHIVKVLFSIEPEMAEKIIRSMIDDKLDWSFHGYEHLKASHKPG